MTDTYTTVSVSLIELPRFKLVRPYVMPIRLNDRTMRLDFADEENGFDDYSDYYCLGDLLTDIDEETDDACSRMTSPDFRHSRCGMWVKAHIGRERENETERYIVSIRKPDGTYATLDACKDLRDFGTGTELRRLAEGQDADLQLFRYEVQFRFGAVTVEAADEECARAAALEEIERHSEEHLAGPDSIEVKKAGAGPAGPEGAEG